MKYLADAFELDVSLLGINVRVPNASKLSVKVVCLQAGFANAKDAAIVKNTARVRMID